MELLQKVTLYDLLGYALPGGVVVGLCGWHGIFGEIEYTELPVALLFAVWFVAGYILGIIISEVTDRIVFIDNKSEDFFDKLCKNYGIEQTELEAALKEAGILNANQTVEKLKDLGQYSGQIYSRVQIDPKYNRLHNYGSGELLYRNMALVSLIAVLLGSFYRNIPEIVLAVLGVVCFILRYMRFSERKEGYTLCWFLDKYNCKEDK